MSTQLSGGACVRCGAPTIPMFTGFACKAECDIAVMPVKTPQFQVKLSHANLGGVWAQLPPAPPTTNPSQTVILTPSDPKGAPAGWTWVRYLDWDQKINHPRRVMKSNWMDPKSLSAGTSFVGSSMWRALNGEPQEWSAGPGAPPYGGFDLEYAFSVAKPTF